MATQFVYSVSDFPNGVALDQLTKDIQDSAITIALEAVTQSGDNVTITFKADLPTADKVVLDGDPAEPPPYTGLVGNHSGVAIAPAPQQVILAGAPSNIDGAIRVATEKTDKSGPDLITPNWADPCTWYYKSVKHEGISLVPKSAGSKIYVPADAAFEGPWIDNHRGRYSDEDDKLTENGDIPRLKVYVDAAPLTEQDPQHRISPEKADVGDFVTDYEKGCVIFHDAPSGVVTADVWKSGSSLWIMAPNPGTRLKLDSAEVQFSKDVSVRDTVIFETYGYVDVFAPQLLTTNGGPYPPGTKIPIKSKKYKTMHNFIDEANGSLPVIPMSSAQEKTWRDLPADVVTYPWNYRFQKILHSAYGMEVRIYLEHDEPFAGYSTATFYCSSESE